MEKFHAFKLRAARGGARREGARPGVGCGLQQGVAAMPTHVQRYVISCDKPHRRPLDWIECDIVQMLQEGETFLVLASS